MTPIGIIPIALAVSLSGLGCCARWEIDLDSGRCVPDSCRQTDRTGGDCRAEPTETRTVECGNECAESCGQKVCAGLTVRLGDCSQVDPRFARLCGVEIDGVMRYPVVVEADGDQTVMLVGVQAGEVRSVGFAGGSEKLFDRAVSVARKMDW